MSQSSQKPMIIKTFNNCPPFFNSFLSNKAVIILHEKNELSHFCNRFLLMENETYVQILDF
ncbi:hypothetical protein C0971_05920 [Bacillus methanolicus]|nr:hypothetical protein C0971_05920 [Bacillus methanolicus]